MSTHIYTQTKRKNGENTLKQCPYCGIPSRGIDIKRCIKNPDREPIRQNTKLGLMINHTKNCKRCGTQFQYSIRELAKSGHKNYCTRSCANSKTLSDATKTKISLGLNRRRGSSLPQLKTLKLICLWCKTSIIQPTSRNQKYCSISCSGKARPKKHLLNPTYLEYKSRCQFQFNLGRYDEFDLGLIKQFGIFSPKINPNGISRDHKISIKFGFQENVDSWYMSHPANCLLMRHTDNKHKNTKCSISFNQLKKDIQLWEAKYPQFDFQI